MRTILYLAFCLASNGATLKVLPPEKARADVTLGKFESNSVVA